MSFLGRLLVNAASLWLVAWIIPGLAIHSFWAALFASLILGILNATIRPLFLFFSLPLNVLTLGFFTLVVNAAVLGLTIWLVPGVAISGFFAAFLAAILLSIISWLLSRVLGGAAKS